MGEKDKSKDRYYYSGDTDDNRFGKGDFRTDENILSLFPADSEKEDALIIKRLYDRDVDAVREIKRKYGKYIQKIAYDITGNISDSEEIENDVLRTVWEEFGIVKDADTNLKEYVRNAAQRLSSARKKKNNRERAHFIDGEDVQNYLENLPDRNNVERQVVLESIIDEYVKTLDKTDMTVFVLRYGKEMTFEEIHGLTGIGTGKIKYRFKKIRKELYRLLRDNEDKK